MVGENDVRLLCWNVNGLRAISRKFGGVAKFLDSLEADIVCIQETKLARSELDRDLALVDGWESFFSFCTTKTGYSGVATFCRKGICVPLTCGASLHNSSLRVDALEAVDLEEIAELDSEGRFLATDHGEFVLINVYAPAITSEEKVEERMDFKLRWYKALKAYTDALVECGRNVILVGDFNVSPYPIDHCDPCSKAQFFERPDRAFFHSMLVENKGNFCDVFRKRNPHRKKAFTCWSQASGARVNNYGTRIDMVLAAEGRGGPGGNAHFLQSFVDADIWSDKEGSDHAPVFAKMNFGKPLQTSDTPPTGSSRWLFPGKQRSLDHWVKTGCRVNVGMKVSDEPCTQKKTGKRRLEEPPSRPGGIKRKKTQLGLDCFLKRTKSSSGGPSIPPPSVGDLPQPKQGNECDSEETKSQVKDREESVAAWKGIFDKMKPPLCRGHSERCVIREVKKQGDNKGRLFFVCARPAGPPPIGRCNFFQWRNNRTIIGGSYNGSDEKTYK
ncbi:hypothetical protein BSKO_09555 [Bryopsis sp. KO-2023]|nr:hypothetical protein BSKO_09555 [Bryopsis sp. KO-2023]